MILHSVPAGFDYRENEYIKIGIFASHWRERDTKMIAGGQFRVRYQPSLPGPGTNIPQSKHKGRL